MSEHEHSPSIVNNKIICSICGEELPQFEEDVARVQSEIRAKRILSTIAADGNYLAITFVGDFMTYSRTKDGLIEELTAKKFGDKDFRVIKKVKGG